MISRKKPEPLAVQVDAGESWHAESGLTAEPFLGSEYGFHTGELQHPCTREELIFQCNTAPATPLVWTPETRRLVPPEAVPFLAEELARYRRKNAESGMVRFGLGLLAVLAAYALWLPDLGFRSILVILPVFLAIRLVGAIHGRVEALRTDASAFPAARARLRHAAWIQGQPARYTEALLGLLIVLFVAELFKGQDAAIQAAGLVKPAIRNGQLWRVVTAPLLHVNYLHIWMNGLALLSTGRLVEAHSRREYLPLAFFLSALVGSLASVVFYPATTSVGASGGIMGVIGFILVLSYQRRETLPPGFSRSILVSIAATAVMGLVAYSVIDNAAHLGGLVAGVLLALIVDLRPANSPASRLFGYLASAGILAGAVTALIAMFG
ncbi:MAG TPA: rhomboid family intramembrane serine protease [Thermoanaerobaculia bacterium]|jgi:membrane associated rhomboid family serine protease|nr:rhomboid family intramembrane serine protease [Thermoanaerobaculia bacterium]